MAMATASWTALLLAVWTAAASGRSPSPPEDFKIGVILPYSSFTFQYRSLQQQLNKSIAQLHSPRHARFRFFRRFNLTYQLVYFAHRVSPSDILDVLCKEALPRNFSVIFHWSDAEIYRSATALAPYFFQLIGYLGIPVLSWSAYRSSIEQKVSKNIILQMAPSLAHQSAAMLSILQRYSWHQFSIVTSLTAGHTDFVQGIRDQIVELQNEFRLTLLATVHVDPHASDDRIRSALAELQNTDTRIVLLCSSRDEAGPIFRAARELGLVGKSYLWIVTQSVVGSTGAAPNVFPVGALGVQFDTSIQGLVGDMDSAVKVLAHGLEAMFADPRDDHLGLRPNLSCNSAAEARWNRGEGFVRYLRNVSVHLGLDKPNLEFHPDGTLKHVELDVVNLNAQLKWEKFGTWQPGGLDIKDIVWPGNSLMPPEGRPEKIYLKVTFVDEPPFISVDQPDTVTGKCINRGVLCLVDRESSSGGFHSCLGTNVSHCQCCSGFSIDLLEKLAADIKFTYDLVRVEDGYWGMEVNGRWNGLVAALLYHKTDLVMTSFKINSMREAVIDFSHPFMDTGIAIVVAKRTGIISPKAFLEPFDAVSWVMILVVSIHIAAFAIFLFEWMSPSGYDMKIHPPREYKFSLLRTYWMVWADLFGASVNVDCPRSFAARFMSSVWAMFAVVFVAIYTANLAAFMITREEYHDLTGIDDKRLTNPYAQKPPFRYGTVPYSNTDAIMQRNHPHIHSYMKHFNRSTVAEGIQAVKKGDLDAFIYDATVLEYLVGQDPECKLLTVGAWYATTGYGVGFPRNSKHLVSFNHRMMAYKENGDLDRLRRFWLAGVCHPEKQVRSSSKPLSLVQFMSAFFLLSLGIVLAVLLLLLEHFYFRYFRKHLAKKDSGGCCALVSLSIGRSLTFRDAVYETRDLLKRHQCRDPVCAAHLWKVKEELGMAHFRIHQLEKLLYADAEGQRRHSRSFLRRPFWKTDTTGRRDWTRERTSSTEDRRALRPRERHEIAEIETVL